MCKPVCLPNQLSAIFANYKKNLFFLLSKFRVIILHCLWRIKLNFYVVKKMINYHHYVWHIGCIILFFAAVFSKTECRPTTDPWRIHSDRLKLRPKELSLKNIQKKNLSSWEVPPSCFCFFKIDLITKIASGIDKWQILIRNLRYSNWNLHLVCF